MKIGVYSVSTCIMRCDVRDLLPLSISVLDLRNSIAFSTKVGIPIPFSRLPGMWEQPTRAIMKKNEWDADADYPSVKQCLKQLAAFLAKYRFTHLFAHRGASFDEKVLATWCAKCKIELPIIFVDTLPLTRHEANCGRRSLRDLVTKHVGKMQMNTSLDCCYALAALLKELEYQGVLTLGDKQGDQTFTAKYNAKRLNEDNQWITQFMDADDDHNGTIDLEEFKRWHIARYESVFKLADANGDGTLSANEFEQFEGTDNWLVEFACADVNGDGTIDIEEFKLWHNAKAEAIFRAVDTNGDGVLSKREFKAMGL